MVSYFQSARKVCVEGSGIGENLLRVRRLRMWTQGRLAREAGVSPTTVSGIETGRIPGPHFGTIGKLARALGVKPEELISSAGQGEGGRPPERASLSLRWAMAVREEEFEREVDEAPLESLNALRRELAEEQARLRRLYGEFPRGSEQRRFVKQQIREVAGQSESVRTSAMFHPDEAAPG